MSDLLVTLSAPDSAEAEVYRSIRGRLLQNGPQQNPIYSFASPREIDSGTGIFAANLAVSLAQSGRSVALIEADLRNPSQMIAPFGLSNEKGLADSLQDQTDSDIQIHWQSGQIENLYLLSAGSVTTHPADLLLQPRMGYLLEHVRQSADIVLLNLPSVFCAETPWLASKTNGLLLLAQRGKTKRSDLDLAQTELEQAGAAVLGAVFLK